MVDGRASWWQSPPLSRGMQYNQVNISINLEQVSRITDKPLENGENTESWKKFFGLKSEQKAY